MNYVNNSSIWTKKNCIRNIIFLRTKLSTEKCGSFFIIIILLMLYSTSAECL